MKKRTPFTALFKALKKKTGVRLTADEVAQLCTRLRDMEDDTFTEALRRIIREEIRSEAVESEDFF